MSSGVTAATEKPFSCPTRSAGLGRSASVAQGAVTHGHRLTALQYQVNHRVVHGGQQMFRYLALHHGDTRNTGFRAPVFGVGGQCPEFVQLIIHGEHLTPEPVSSASKKQKQAGFE